jgi:hypothetical protein
MRITVQSWSLGEHIPPNGERVIATERELVWPANNFNGCKNWRSWQFRRMTMNVGRKPSSANQTGMPRDILEMITIA